LENFTPFSALAGGALIGLAATALLLLDGRVLGISGVVGGSLGRPNADTGWRLALLAGLATGGVLLMVFFPATVDVQLDRPLGAVVLAGLLVGFGTRMGNGCTSGHGVCGISRMSPRSLVATCTFMAAGFVTVPLVRALMGGV